MALQKVFVVDGDKTRSSEIETVLSFLDYKVKSIAIEKLKSTINSDESPLIIVAEGVDFKEEYVHSFFENAKNQQPFLYIYNKGKAPKISKTLASYLVPLEWPTSYQKFINCIRQLQSAEHSLNQEVSQRATDRII